jgi:transposase
MDCASVPDLDSMDRDALVAIYMAQQQKLTSLISAQDEELRRLEAELESHRQTLSEQRQALSEQSDELHSRSERIEHLKMMVEKLRHVIFGAKSEKILIQLGQLELQLEDDETTHAEVEASVERSSSA